MKTTKKLVALGLAFAVCLGLGAITACSKDNGNNSSSASSEAPAPAEYVYKIRVQSVGGFGLRGATVTLKDGETVVATKTTSSQGDAYFTTEDVPQTGEYAVSVSELPEGWLADVSVKYQTGLLAGSDLTIPCTPQLISTPASASTRYRLGSVMHDFTVTTSENKEFTLSKVLQEKDMVLLNFFYDGCGPCATEFPVMQNAYVERQDDIEILAVSTRDSQTAVAAYKEKMGLTFHMAGSTDFSTLFGVSSVPYSVVIDRFGVVSYAHLGAMTAKSDFTGLFDKFTGENYMQTVLGSGDYEGSGNTGTEEEEKVKPNVSAPAFADLDKVLDPTGIVTESTYAWDEDEYSWPWTVQTGDDGVKYLRASNADVHNSYSILHLSVTAQENTALLFDTLVSTEKDADMLYVYVDGTPIQKLSGLANVWKTQTAYVFEEGQAGEHVVSFCYLKDLSSSQGEDEVWIKNLRFVALNDLSSVQNLNDSYVFRHAATGFNTPVNADTPLANDQKKTKFARYADVVYNEADGYYHVNEANGPILFADVLGATPWNTFDLWQLAYNKYLIVDGVNLEENVEYFAAAATNAGVSVVPVTQELKELLDLLVSVDTFGEEYDADYHANAYYDPAYHVSYHENEWLELCCYYDAYAGTPAYADPTVGVWFDGAIEIQAGNNHIECDKSLVPVGIKHKFTPTESGVYHLYSTVAGNLQGTSANTDPMCWIFDADKQTELAYSDDTLLLAPNGNADNFSLYLYMEKGVTYYCLFAFFLNATGEFDMTIEKVSDGDYIYLDHCASGTYSFNPVTNENFVPGAVEYVLHLDGFYHAIETNEKGNKTIGGKLYLDMVNATYLFPNDSFETALAAAEKYAPAKRLFYLDGVDYTDILKQYLHKAKVQSADEAHYGLAAIDETLLTILEKLMIKADAFGGVKNSWQFACYYDKTVYAKNA